MKTLSGSHIEITDAIDNVLQSALISGATIETGSGTKSPDNPYVLSGTTKLTVSDGTTPHDYILSQTLNSLPNGTYDTFEAVAGLLTQKVGKLILDGTQTPSQWVNKSTTFGVYFTAPGLKNGSYYSVNPAYCSHFKNVVPATLSSATYLDAAIAIWDSSQHIMVQIPFAIFGGNSANTFAQNAVLLKTWLTANPVTALYELAVPVTMQGVGQQIRTHYPYTLITNDADANMTVVTPTMDDLIASQPAWQAPKIWGADENINFTDWQRIDDNVWRIADFYGMELPYKTWQHTSRPSPAEVSRIESNINTLLDQTHSFQSKFDYQLLNDIESLLLALHEKVVELQLSVRRAGAFSAGQEIFIPIGGIT